MKKKLQFELEFPDGQEVDEGEVVEQIRTFAEKGFENTIVRVSHPGMAEMEAKMAMEQAEREAEKAASDKEVKAFSERVDKAVAKFSNEDLPDAIKGLPEAFRQQYKIREVTERLALEERE